VTRARWRLVALVALVVLLVLAGVGYIFGTDSDPGTAAAPSTSTFPPADPTTAPSERDPESGLRWVEVGALPREAQRTVALIEDGGPYPYAKDGRHLRQPGAHPGDATLRLLPRVHRGHPG